MMDANNKIKVAIVGSVVYENKRKIKEFIFKLKEKFKDNLIILSGGRKHGADTYVRKYALEFGIQYREYNPAHTVKNLYSVMPTDYYNKAFFPAQIYSRNKVMIDSAEYVIVFKLGHDEDKDIDSIINSAQKKYKKLIIIN